MRTRGRHRTQPLLRLASIEYWPPRGALSCLHQPPEHIPTHTHRAPPPETSSHKSSSEPANRNSLAKESPRTFRCMAQTAIRGICTAPSRHQTTPQKAESHGADTDRASQTACHRSCAPPAAGSPAAWSLRFRRRVNGPRAARDTTRQRSTPPAAQPWPEAAPAPRPAPCALVSSFPSRLSVPNTTTSSRIHLSSPPLPYTVLA